MNFNWIGNQDIDENLLKKCVDLEFELRYKITKFLIRRLDVECNIDFTRFYFDVDMTTKTIRISEKTPQEYVQEVAADFYKEMGQSN